MALQKGDLVQKIKRGTLFNFNFGKKYNESKDFFYGDDISCGRHQL